MILWKVVGNTNICSGAKLLAHVILALDHNNVGCFATNEYLMNKLGVSSTKTITRYISELNQEKFIDIEQTNKYKSGRILRITNKVLPSKQEYTLNRKNLRSNDIESDWFDEYMKNR